MSQSLSQEHPVAVKCQVVYYIVVKNKTGCNLMFL